MVSARGNARVDGIAIALAVLVGLVLRVLWIDDQIVQDDEIHSVRAAVEHGPLYVFTHHGEQDFGIPLTLWNQLLLATVGLDEVGLRLPLLVSGAAFVLLLGVFAARRFGTLAGACAAWIAAFSPFLVFYSRFARPYGLVLVASLASIAGFVAFVRHGSRKGAWTCALAGAVAVFASVLAAPTVALLWAVALAIPPNAERSRRDALRLAITGAVATAALVVPSLPSLVEVARIKSGEALSLTLGSWRAAWASVVGTPHATLGVLALGLVAAGIVVVLRRDHRLALVGLAALGLQAGFVTLLAPRASGQGMVLARYTAPALPFLFLFLGVGLGSVVGLAARPLRGARARAALLGTVAVSLGALAWDASFAGAFGFPNDFTSHRRHYDHFDRRERRRHIERGSPLYERLARSDPVRRVLEAPWIQPWHFVYYDLYQARHRKEVVCAAADEWLTAQGLRLRRLVPAVEQAFDPSVADLVIVHRDPVAELAALGGEPLPEMGRVVGGKRERLSCRAERIRDLCLDYATLAVVYEDAWVTAFAPADRVAELRRDLVE